MKQLAGINIPNKYDERVEDIELVNMYEDEWECDGIHYLVYLSRPFIESTKSLLSVIGCVSKSEVMKVIRNAVRVDESEWDKHCA